MTHHTNNPLLDAAQDLMKELDEIVDAQATEDNHGECIGYCGLVDALVVSRMRQAMGKAAASAEPEPPAATLSLIRSAINKLIQPDGSGREGFGFTEVVCMLWAAATNLEAQITGVKTGISEMNIPPLRKEDK